MATVRVSAHLAQVRIILERKAAADAAAERYVDAVQVVAAGAGITEGTLETIDDATGELTFTVADPDPRLSIPAALACEAEAYRAAEGGA